MASDAGVFKQVVGDLVKKAIEKIEFEVANIEPLDLIRSILRQCKLDHPEYNVVLIRHDQVFTGDIFEKVCDEIYTFKKKTVKLIIKISNPYQLRILIFKRGSLTVLCDQTDGSSWGKNLQKNQFIYQKNIKKNSNSCLKGCIGNVKERIGTQENIFIFEAPIKDTEYRIHPERPGLANF